MLIKSFVKKYQKMQEQEYIQFISNFPWNYICLTKKQYFLDYPKCTFAVKLYKQFWLIFCRKEEKNCIIEWGYSWEGTKLFF